MPLHPAEDLCCCGERADRRSQPRRSAQMRRRARDQNVRGRGRREQRPDQVRSAALVLSRAMLPVLVGADRDVLRTVVRSEVAATEREQSRRDREEARRELLRGGTECRRAHALEHHRAPEQRGKDARTLERQLCLGQYPLHARQKGKRLRDARGPAQDRVPDATPDHTLPFSRDLERPVVAANGACPRRRAVNEDAVAEGHSTETHLVRHRGKRSPAPAAAAACATVARRGWRARTMVTQR